jgi:hypothetical protein
MSSSYTSVLCVAGSFPSAFVASHSFHCCIICQFLCIWRLALSIFVEVFLRPFFPDIAPSRMFTTNSLCLIICPIHEWRIFFKIFKSKLSSFAFWKTSLFYLSLWGTQITTSGATTISRTQSLQNSLMDDLQVSPAWICKVTWSKVSYW